MNRAKILHLLYRLATKKNWLIALQSGTAKSGADGKLVLKSGKGEKTLAVKPDVFLFRAFGEQLFQVRETALVGGRRDRDLLVGDGHFDDRSEKFRDFALGALDEDGVAIDGDLHLVGQLDRHFSNA